MQSNRWFWKSWHTSYKLHGYFLAGLLFCALACTWFYYARGYESVISWEKFQEQKVVETTIHEFSVGPFEFSVPANVYLLFEYFQGSVLRPNSLVSYLFVLVVAVTFIYFMSIFSALERFWYLASMGVVILFLVALRLDVLKIANLEGRWTTIAVIVLYVGTSFFINAFRSSASFGARFLVFGSITAVVALGIYYLAAVPAPFLYIGVTAYVPAILLTVLFIMLTAQEIPAAFLYITSQSQPAKGMRHFLIIMAIYLVNVCLLYAQYAKLVDWNIHFVDAYLLLSIATVVGIWGWRHRETNYSGAMPFYPLGAYFYLLMANVTFITLAFLEGNANDAPLHALRGIIIFCYIGFGLAFLLYILSNFLGITDRNLSAWKVLYKPNRMPYETFRLGGIIIVLGFVFYNNWRAFVYDGFSGFWNAMGDLYVHTERYDVARTYYEQGRTYGFGNHHSNYAIGYKHAVDFQWDQSHEYYQRAVMTRPSSFAYANDANIYNWEGKSFNTIHSLRRSTGRMPDSYELKNNLGFAYSKVHALDSALYFLGEARERSSTRAAAETNFVGAAAQELFPINPDSLASLFDVKNPGVATNALGLATITRTIFKSEVSPFREGALNLHQANLLHNYILNAAYTISDKDLALAEKIARDSANASYAEALKAALAHAFYLQGNVTQALQLMSELSYLSAVNQGKYNYLIGLWLLEQEDPEGAALAFRYALNYNYAHSLFYVAVAETENRNIPEAVLLWDSLSRGGNEEEKKLSSTMKGLLGLSFNEALQQEDPIKYQYCRYRFSSRDSVLFNVMVNAMKSPDYKAQSLLEMAMRQSDMGRFSLARRYLQEAAQLPVTSQTLKQKIAFAEFQLLAQAGDLDELAIKVKDMEFSLDRKLEKLYYEALLNEAGGDKKKAADNFGKLEKANPFFEEGIIGAALYAKKYSDDPMKSYSTLAEAVQVNKTSVRLWKAYYAEALERGFDEYAANAKATLSRLVQR
jgi:hypothetical protein